MAPILRPVDHAAAEPGASYAKVPLRVDLLRNLRRRRGLSQHEMSMCVGVRGAGAVSAWERGVSVPRPATLVRVAEVLGVEPLELLALDEAALSLRELRVIRGMTLRGLAQAANTSPSALRRWESGDFIKVPGPKVVLALARALDVDLARVEAVLVEARNLAGGPPRSKVGADKGKASKGLVRTLG